MKWKIIGEDAGACPFPQFCYRSTVAKTTEFITGVKSKRYLFIYQNDLVVYCSAPGNIASIGKKIMQMIIEDSSFGKKISAQVINDANELNKYIEKLKKVNLAKKNNQQLFSLYKNFINNYQNIFVWGIVAGYLDFEKPILTNYLENIIQRQIKKVKVKLRIGEYFSVLITPIKYSFIKKVN